MLKISAQSEQFLALVVKGLSVRVTDLVEGKIVDESVLLRQLRHECSAGEFIDAHPGCGGVAGCAHGQSTAVRREGDSRAATRTGVQLQADFLWHLPGIAIDQPLATIP